MTTKKVADQRLPLPGQLVHVRQRQYLVEGIDPSFQERDCSVVKLSCIDDDNQGAPLTVFWEKEPDRRILTGESWEKVTEKGFDDPEMFAAYLHTLRWNCVTATDPKLFQAPFRAGIKIEAYQLEPLKRALLMPRVNLFIADDVGLGKTIEAGLILRELLLRKKAKYLVVAAPPSMIQQWQSELENRFGLTFEIFDREYIQKVRRERGYAVNPWTTHSRFLISHKLLIDEDYAAPLRTFLGEFEAGTAIVLDEAHHAAPSTSSRYAIDSQITRAVRDLAPRFEHRLFLSATPHNGHSNSFSALLEILDPQRFCRGVKVNPKHIRDILIRRLKDDLRHLQGGFPERIVNPIVIDNLSPDAPELKLPLLLDEYAETRSLRLNSTSKRFQATSSLVISNLQQRLLSSVEAFARTLKKHRDCVETQASESAVRSISDIDPSQLDLLTGGIGSDDDRAADDEGLNEAEELVQVGVASQLGPSGSDVADLLKKERSLLTQMHDIAQKARHEPDEKIKKLLEWVRVNMCKDLPHSVESDGSGALWNDTRIIIFTEWDDTKRYILNQIQPLIDQTDLGSERIEVFHGPTSSAKREEIKRAFNADPKTNPVRILIATDAAREGLNLQSQCWNLFHFDIPWNPSRMEQRNGRIDRKLQPKEKVFCHYFYYSQRPEDRILTTIVRKSETIRKELGSLAQVVDSKLTERLTRGFRRQEIEKLDKELGTLDQDGFDKQAVEEELESARARRGEIQEQIDDLRTQLEKSFEAIGWDKKAFQDALSSALRLQNAPELKAIKKSDSGETLYEFPRMDTLSGAATSWSDTMDALRSPKKSDEKYWEWKKNSQIRPVVFSDPGILDDSIVHLHLEHRITQRLLGRFSSQGFTSHDLSRTCFTQTNDNIPRVVLLGRVALFGPNAARLHEEIVTVTARWTDPEIRKGALEPYSKDGEKKTLEILERALSEGQSKNPDKVVVKRLQNSSAADVEALRAHLEIRAQSTIDDAKNELRKRANKESSDMIQILQDQKKRLTETSNKYADPQMAFGFVDDERKQLELNRKHWGKRLEALEKELSSEPKRIIENYEVKATRIEPIGLIYLWPRTG